VALQEALVPRVHEQLDELGRQEAAQRAHPVQLRDLLSDP
jgi:hypothetical protein